MNNKYSFFWGKHDFQSNFYQPANFTVDGVEFNCSEQYFMYKKAVHFNDFKTSDAILNCKEPYLQKQLGRKVENFNEDVWDKVSILYMYEACYYKFSQNEELKELLIKTSGLKNVEASPFDTIWGIGLGEGDFRAKDESLWKGKNLLGKILDKVRDDLIQEREPRKNIKL